ncbi:MAG: flavodoxin domain-containing protein [Verrucomicrobium sp.]|nr:flavodoxin domain-containing protein [Verrucomicrobium sp.]
MSRAVPILYASNTGHSAQCAEATAAKARELGLDLEPHLAEMRAYDPASLPQEKEVLFVTSTWGRGEPPSGAMPLWRALRDMEPGSLEGVRYAVLALGDTRFPKFCQFGRDLDARLQELGATPMGSRVECDRHFEKGLAKWLDRLPAFFQPPRSRFEELKGLFAGITRQPGPAHEPLTLGTDRDAAR